MKIGLIQSQGIGDIIIGLPIAAWYAARGHTVYWPVNEFYIPFLEPAAPYVRFLSVSADPDQVLEHYYYDIPMAMLKQEGCDRIFTLDRNYAERKTSDLAMADALKFDEYKYAAAGVPFTEKWNFQIERDMGREILLRKRLNIRDKYVCVHSNGSDISHILKFPGSWYARYTIIEMKSISDNPFDWLHTIENADKLVMLDSVFANIVEQMNIAKDKYLILRSPGAVTPVFKNGWRFLHPSVKRPDGVLECLNGEGWDE